MPSDSANPRQILRITPPRLPARSASFLKSNSKRVKNHSHLMVSEKHIGGTSSECLISGAPQNAHFLISARWKDWSCSVHASKYEMGAWWSLSSEKQKNEISLICKGGVLLAALCKCKKVKSNFLRRCINFLGPCRIMLMAECSRPAMFLSAMGKS